MSKGGAGKVYFVLYLAVILELLIIIVERDEAEEHLVQKQKESMKIVQSILSQLQSGSGTEGINTRPQDEITLQEGAQDAGGPKIKQDRTYFIEVGVTDVSTSDKLEGTEKEKEEKRKTLINLANVKQLDYQVFYNSSQDPERAPDFPSDDSLQQVSLSSTGQRVGAWELRAVRRLELDVDGTTAYKDPKYKDYTLQIGELGSIAPAEAISKDSVFRYSKTRTEELAALNRGKIKKRTFVVHFKAPSTPGWYKLRFSSQTNRILGVSGAEFKEASDDQKVNIGTVQLKVKELREVQKDLLTELETYKPPTFDEIKTGTVTVDNFEQKIEEVKQRITDRQQAEAKRNNLIGKAELYSYIIRLLSPQLSSEFKQNRNSIQIDVRVIKPTRTLADPVIADLPPTVRVFDGVSQIEIPFRVSPANGTTNISANTAGATLGGSAGTASASGGAGGQLDKKLVIPVRGRLSPGEYSVTIEQRNGPKAAEPAVCKVYVYPSKLENEEEVKGSLEVGYGDNIVFTAIPASGSVIPANQFVTDLKIGDADQRPAFRKLSFNEADNLTVPKEATRLSLAISWESPYAPNERVVLLPEFSVEPSLNTPNVAAVDAKASTIAPNTDPIFVVTGVLVKAPSLGSDEKAEITDVRVDVDDATVRDIQTKQTYKVVPVGKPRKTAGDNYEFSFKLSGGPIPLKPGRVKGSVKLRVTATASGGGKTSKRDRPFTVTVSN